MTQLFAVVTPPEAAHTLGQGQTASCEEEAEGYWPVRIGGETTWLKPGEPRLVTAEFGARFQAVCPKGKVERHDPAKHGAVVMAGANMIDTALFEDPDEPGTFYKTPRELADALTTRLKAAMGIKDKGKPETAPAGV